jgi:hypothetical protein
MTEQIKNIWRNTKYTPEEKFFELYMEMSKDEDKSIGQMAYETGYNETTIKILIRRKEQREQGQHGKI